MAAEGAYPMNPVVGFDRDPMSHSPSAGEYRFADGSTLYGDDPELYGQVSSGDPNMSGGGQGYEEPLQSTAAAPVPDYYGTGTEQNYVADFTEDPGTGMSVPPAPAPPPAAMSVDAESRMDSPEGQAFTAQQQAERDAAMKAQAKQDFLRTHKAVGYSPGISQGQLQAKSATGVEIPVASTTQVTPGVPDTAADRVARYKGDTKADFQAQERADFEQAKLTNQIAHLKQDEQNISQQVLHRAIERDIAKDTVDKQMGVLDQTEKAYKEHKVDPKRIYGGSTFAEIGAIIAQAGGAYAAILGGGPNYAQQIIDNAIDRDIAVQRLEHEQLGDAADNAYTRFLRMTGDKKDAEEMLRATQHRLAGVERERFAAESGREEVGIALGEWGVAEAQRRQEREVAIRERMMGKVVQSMQSQVAYPKAATGGGYRQKTIKELRQEALDESRFETELSENTAKRAKADTTVAEETGAGGKTKVDPLYVEGFGRAPDATTAQNARHGLQQYENYKRDMGILRQYFASKPDEVSPELRSAAQLARANVAVAKATAMQGGTGVLKPDDYERVDPFIPKIGPTAFAANKVNEWTGFASSATQKLDALEKDDAAIKSALIRQSVQGQHPDIPQPGAAEAEQ